MVSSWWFEGRRVTIFAGHVWLHGFSNMLPCFQIYHFFCQHTRVWNHLKTSIFDMIFEILLIPFLTLTPKSLPLSIWRYSQTQHVLFPQCYPPGNDRISRTCWVDDFPNHTVNGAEMLYSFLEGIRVPLVKSGSSSPFYQYLQLLPPLPPLHPLAGAWSATSSQKFFRGSLRKRYVEAFVFFFSGRWKSSTWTCFQEFCGQKP